MSEPCQQVSRLETVDEKLDKLTEILTTVAVQKNEIEHLVSALSDLKNWLKLLEARMQLQEQAGGQSASKFLWIIVTALAASCIGAAVTAISLVARG